MRRVVDVGEVIWAEDLGLWEVGGDERDEEGGDEKRVHACFCVPAKCPRTKEGSS